MDFRSRGGQTSVPPTSTTSSNSVSSKLLSGKWLERGSFVLLVAVAVIILALAGLAFFSGNNEAKAVNKDRYQAVFLNNGQVYFGNVRGLNSRFIDLRNIYYLQTNEQNATAQQNAGSNNVSLVKLGCELHAPFDQMVINRDQVIFWENLKDDSQVVKAIGQYKKDNPNGQTCNTSSQNSTQQAPSTNTQQNSTTSPAPSSNTTPTQPTPTPKKP